MLTVCPVIVGLMITSVVIFTAGFGTLRDLILNLGIMVILVILMTFSYLNARKS